MNSKKECTAGHLIAGLWPAWPGVTNTQPMGGLHSPFLSGDLLRSAPIVSFKLRQRELQWTSREP